MLLKPPALQQGDTVTVLSTARKISLEEIQPAISILESWGLKVKIGVTIGLAHHQYAGTDAERLADFQSALDDSSIKAIFCARGGYGTVRFMDAIDYNAFMKHPKWIIGYSDVTYLHTHITNTLGIQTLHASMLFNFPKNTSEALNSMKSELFGEKNKYQVEPHLLNRMGNSSGILIGGNLSILYSITGTHSGMNVDGKILFIEDIDEQLYHIDRMMINLKRSNKLQRLAGLIVGGMTDMKDNAVPFGKTAEEIIVEHVAEFEYPVCFGFPAGHIDDNRALVMGRTISLKVSPNGAIIE